MSKGVLTFEPGSTKDKVKVTAHRPDDLLEKAGSTLAWMVSKLKSDDGVEFAPYEPEPKVATHTVYVEKEVKAKQVKGKPNSAPVSHTEESTSPDGGSKPKSKRRGLFYPGKLKTKSGS